jgi:hypothetical protein
MEAVQGARDKLAKAETELDVLQRESQKSQMNTTRIRRKR